VLYSDQVVEATGCQIVENPDRVPCFKEAFREMRADEPGAARYSN
jgi:hypothetical protein